MPLQTYTVSYSLDGISGFTALTNLQGIQISLGRGAQLEQVKASTATFELRYPTGYASPVTALVSGTYIKIENTTGSAYTIWRGRISDVSARYGIPFVSGVGQADFLSVTCEGNFAAVGRMQGENYAMAAGGLSQQCLDAYNESGVEIQFITSGGEPQMAATTVSSTWADWVARAALTVNARLWDSSTANGSWIVSPFFSNVSTVNFSDTENNATNQIYNQINFDSLSDNFYTQIQVDPESYGVATVTQAGASLPYRTYQVNTLNDSTSQATDYANYLLANYGTARFAISSFTCMAEAQSSFQLDKIGYESLMPQAPGTQVSVAFRGTTYQCIIEGVTMSATPAGASFTYFVSGADLNAYLILDNTVFGKLNENKLGY
jgi:hypothetical protein